MGFRNLQRSGTGGGGAGDIEGVTAGSGLTGGGVSGTVALAVDHATATPAAPGTAAVGTATKSAREDHVHAPLIRKVIEFYVVNAAANTTNYGNRQSGLTDYPFFVAPRACQVTAMSVRTSGNPAGSTALVRVEKNASGTPDTGLTVSVPAGATRSFYGVGAGVSLAAGDTLRACVVTDASWTGTTVDFCIDVEITETA